MTKYKIKSSKSEALYDVLIGTLGVSDDHYEKESFIYHHSVCNHEREDYKLNISSNLNTTWTFSILNSDNWIECENLNDPSHDVILEQKALKNKLNTLIKYILEN